MTFTADYACCNLIGAANIPALTHKNLYRYTIRIFPHPPFPLRAPPTRTRKIRMARESTTKHIYWASIGTVDLMTFAKFEVLLGWNNYRILAAEEVRQDHVISNNC